MDDKQVAVPKQTRLAIPSRRTLLSDMQLLALRTFLGWFKQPSNLLSVAAIVAVVMVPWIEKIVKSDEEVRAKIDTLLDTTNKVIGYDRQRMTTPPSDLLNNSVLEAQRENDLARASAIASSIEQHVYPAVLFALSHELCANGEFTEAKNYLREVLKRGTGIHFLSPRPSVNELTQAHVIRAYCFAEQFREEGNKMNDKKLADDEMLVQSAV